MTTQEEFDRTHPRGPLPASLDFEDEMIDNFPGVWIISHNPECMISEEWEKRCLLRTMAEMIRSAHN